MPLTQLAPLRTSWPTARSTSSTSSVRTSRSGGAYWYEDYKVEDFALSTRHSNLARAGQREHALDARCYSGYLYRDLHGRTPVWLRLTYLW